MVGMEPGSQANQAPGECPVSSEAAQVEHTDQSDRPYQEKLFDPSVDFTYSEAKLSLWFFFTNVDNLRDEMNRPDSV